MSSGRSKSLNMWRKQSLVLTLLSFICFCEFLKITQADSSPTVVIRNGTLVGTVMRSRKDREFFAFRGIPYAQPPLGKLRFEPPKPVKGWSGTRSAKEDANICTQRNIYTHQEEIVGVEDCLYLNVYTPKIPGSSKDDKYRGGLPVMIWFHGGGWLTGAGHSEFYGPKFLLDHNVILVTINFRLGPLGFLSTEDMTCPGNQGMKDQAQSIRWVNENIAAFGGDPNRVTIFGESAGGASVHHHMISPLSKGLFHRGISQSGNAYCPWTLSAPGSAKQKAKIVGKHLNCPTDNSKKLIECLRGKDAMEIIGTDRLFQEFDYCPMIPFRPVIEPNHPGAFLTEDPVIAGKTGRIADIPWMTGFTSHEGSLRVPGLYGLEGGKLIKQLNDEFLRIAPITLLYGETCPKHLHDDIGKKIRDFYFENRPIDNSTKFDVIDMYSDSWFNYAAYSTVRDHFETFSSPIFYYYFAYRGSASFSRIFGDPTENYGVSHADELQYLFPVGEQLFQDIPLSKTDNQIIDIITTLWTNFASFANPTPEVTPVLPTKWKPVRTSALEYLHIESPSEIFMSDNLLIRRLKFWDTLPIREKFDSDKINARSKDEL